MINPTWLKYPVNFNHCFLKVSTMLKKVLAQNLIHRIIFKWPGKDRQVNDLIRGATNIDIQIPLSLAITAAYVNFEHETLSLQLANLIFC